MSIFQSENYFTTPDLGLASALVALGFTVSHLDKQNPRRVEFFFEHSKELDDCVQAYWASTLDVIALTYFNAMRMLKSRIYRE